MKKTIVRILSCALGFALFLYGSIAHASEEKEKSERDYIRWVDFTPTAEAMRDALAYDISTYGGSSHEKMSSVLAAVAAVRGGNFKGYKKADTENALSRGDGVTLDEKYGEKKLYRYYKEAYSAVFDGMVCSYREYSSGAFTEKYGLCAYSPIAEGYYYTDYDDFGDSRSFGYKREHLGHDIMGSVGTPIIAVESGYVEACGWNMYGGWRLGIRSFDGKRYYYYAHLRKGHPYADMYEGKIVDAGEVIGYLGMTGYSRKEDTNNINTPHLHYGLELIFDKSQKDGNVQIWLDMYELTEFLSSERAKTEACGKERVSSEYRIPEYMWD